MLSPIAESPLKEIAAELELEDDEALEAGRRRHGHDSDGDDDEEHLLAADALRRRPFAMMPLEIEAALKSCGHSSSSSSSSSGSGGGSSSLRGPPYVSVRTEEPPFAPAGAVPPPALAAAAAGALPAPAGAVAAAASAAAMEAPRTPQMRPPPPLSATSRMVGEILASPRGGFECPFPPLFDEEHPDPCECLCNLIRMPRVPSAPHNYLIYRSRRDGRIYTLGPHWAGLVFTIVLVCVASSLFVRNVCRGLGAGYVLVAVAYTALTLLTLLRTACLDPGFITRSAPETLPRRKYCSVCRIYTPPAAAHCDDCGTCIEGLDHHCPWTGHCIGRRNMGAFICFNCTWLTYAAFVLVCLALQNGLLGGGGSGSGGGNSGGQTPISG